jgi:hypothetical protein
MAINFTLKMVNKMTEVRITTTIYIYNTVTLLTELHSRDYLCIVYYGMNLDFQIWVKRT